MEDDPDEARLVVGDCLVVVVDGGGGVVGQDRLPHFLVCLLEHWDLLGGHCSLVLLCLPPPQLTLHSLQLLQAELLEAVEAVEVMEAVEAVEGVEGMKGVGGLGGVERMSVMQVEGQ